ncbi:MAG: ferritin family protein [Thermoplasmata archaeon]|nr:MAG: ferritin family protein [Thermoplasmata archaeon]
MTDVDKTLGALLQAIEIEKFGYDFYYNMREFVPDVEGQRLVSYLGKLEIDHINWLEEEYDRQLTKMQDFDEEPKVDISLLGKEKIFLEQKDLPDLFKDFDPQKALDYAIQLEMRSIEFYESNIEISDDDKTRDLFKRLADFERDHIVILSDNLKSLQEKGRWIPPK